MSRGERPGGRSMASLGAVFNPALERCVFGGSHTSTAFCGVRPLVTIVYALLVVGVLYMRTATDQTEQNKTRQKTRH